MAQILQKQSAPTHSCRILLDSYLVPLPPNVCSVVAADVAWFIRVYFPSRSLGKTTLPPTPPGKIRYEIFPRRCAHRIILSPQVEKSGGWLSHRSWEPAHGDYILNNAMSNGPNCRASIRISYEIYLMKWVKSCCGEGLVFWSSSSHIS